MPVETRISERFGELVGKIMGEDTYGKAAIKTSISQAYILAMHRGKVPTLRFVQKFIDGYKVDAITASALLVAAGYESPSPELRATSALREIPDMETKVQVFLNGASELPDFAKDQIREMVKDAWEKRKKETARGKP